MDLAEDALFLEAIKELIPGEVGFGSQPKGVKVKTGIRVIGPWREQNLLFLLQGLECLVVLPCDVLPSGLEFLYAFELGQAQGALEIGDAGVEAQGLHLVVIRGARLAVRGAGRHETLRVALDAVVGEAMEPVG